MLLQTINGHLEPFNSWSTIFASSGKIDLLFMGNLISFLIKYFIIMEIFWLYLIIKFTGIRSIAQELSESILKLIGNNDRRFLVCTVGQIGNLPVSVGNIKSLFNNLFIKFANLVIYSTVYLALKLKSFIRISLSIFIN
jgi:hypothetical protein